MRSFRQLSSSSSLSALIFCFTLAAVTQSIPAAGLPNVRPPSVPLVACDPYFSIWSPADNLSGADTVHWTGKPHRLTSLLRIDGKVFRLMGKEPASAAAFTQTGVEVLPTRTIYHFEGAGVQLALTFMTPALPEDLMVYSRPVTYVTFEASSRDGVNHEIEIYLDADTEIAVNSPDQPVRWETRQFGSLTALAVGSVEQPILRKRGDDLRIDWGRFFLAAEKKQVKASSLTHGPGARTQFAADGTLPTTAQAGQATGVNPVLAIVLPLAKVGANKKATHLLLAYDDEYSIQYFKKDLRPYWRRKGADAESLLRQSSREYESLTERCTQFDKQLISATARAGGDAYAQICALAYRQCCAANKVVADANGQPLMFPKENFSNGCIGTVDVIYPMAPQFLLFSPSLTKAMLVPIMDYAASERWRWPFAPHDLGTYPLANGQVYGGGERTEEDQMPVEETGNMLVLLAALAKVEGTPAFSEMYWPVLEKWAAYLKAKGFDPENQLCTDDFAGHLAHNVNLSAKAICGLGAYAQLCAMRGLKDQSDSYYALARQFAARWVKEGDEDDHTKLAFDKPQTWSQKYNLVWDRILGLKLFPESVARKEMTFYKNHQNTYGLPLDSRKNYTKLDWTLWTATLTQDRQDFEALVNPVYKFLNESPSRVPMTDWFDTISGKMSGFQARSVVGGVFLQMLYDAPAWTEWTRRDRTRSAKWAPLPKPPELSIIAPTSEREGLTWKYTTEMPDQNWSKPDFNDSGWKQGTGGFGSKGTPGAVVRSDWTSKDIWLRRELELPARKWKSPSLMIHHDEDAEIYLNGVLATQLPGFSSSYEVVPLPPAAQTLLHPGRNLIAVHCKQTSGGQYIDVGLVEATPTR